MSNCFYKILLDKYQCLPIPVSHMTIYPQILEQMEKNNINIESISNSFDIFVQNSKPRQIFFKFTNFCYEKFKISNSSNKSIFVNLKYSDIKIDKQIDDFFKLWLIYIQGQNIVIFENLFNENNEDFISFLNQINQTLKYLILANQKQIFQDFCMIDYQPQDDEINDEDNEQDISKESIEYENLIKYEFEERWPQKKI